jgi:RimJ/RimL family protein N-acetyltransferase
MTWLIRLRCSTCGCAPSPAAGATAPAAVRWLTEYLFTELPEIKRIEGHTRSDNVAMQRVFARCGYVREAHHRQAWNNSDGTVHDSYGYAILRQDWLTGDSTPVDL